MAALSLKPVPAVIGAAVGAAIFLIPRALASAIHVFAGASGVLILLLVYALTVLLAYIIGAVTVGGSAGEFFRGLLIGGTAAMNWMVASVVFPKVFGAGAGTILAVVVAVYPFLSSFPVISRSAVYSGVLGYLNWLLPMSWPIVALGFTFFLLCLLGALFPGLLGVEFFKIQKVAFHWQTGTLFIRGGWISNLNPIDTAFNMGNFAFADVKFGEMAEDHESGHTLNLAVFGSLFHLIGAFDENVINGESALSERLAESHVPGSSRPTLAMWV